jgi:hypothetical protein
MAHDFDLAAPEGGEEGGLVPLSSEYDEDGGIDVGASSAAEEFVDVITKESDENAYMSEAERRLDLAGYYNQLVRGEIFQSDEPGARQVEGELRAFARGRLQVLLGIRPDDQPLAAVKPQFTDEEAAVLHRFAAMSEAEQKVFWALIATAARSKSVVGPVPAKAPQAPAKVIQVQEVPRAAPSIKKIAAPSRPNVTAPVQQPAPAPQPAQRRQPPQKQRVAAPEAAPAPPRPVPMPRGKSLESVMMHTAITQTTSGERLDEAYRSGRSGDVKVQR